MLNLSKIPSRATFEGDLPTFVASDDLIEIPSSEFDVIELYAGNHIVPLTGNVNTLYGDGYDVFVATNDTNFAWIDYFNEGDTINLYAFGFTDNKHVVENAKDWENDEDLSDEYHYTAVTITSPSGAKVTINNMTFADFEKNVDAIVDLTPTLPDLV
ncbi:MULTISPECIES: hypothetical protein [unclassified Chelatococcus]|uniref:hypothetical protein n=1 Tax=unclassified Chelatococcus TaxID=2638111 RepID=UPI001BCCD152|nr:MULTISPECIES: hypothetical protein [unclassified Chelatococcus]MBS7695824.1 hypothetical protein [Chelatococcus sp. YT9]MBX3555801.1 hypothetical protein [Chelatococcus sp.]